GAAGTRRRPRCGLCIAPPAVPLTAYMRRNLGGEEQRRMDNQGVHRNKPERQESRTDHGKRPTIVLHVGGLYRGSEKAAVERGLGRRPGVLHVEATPVAQTATVTYDAGRTSVAELRQWVQDCGYQCAGQSVPTHVCDPMAEPDPPSKAHGAHAETAVVGRTPTAPRPEEPMPPGPTVEHARHGAAREATARSADEAMGHGGHAGLSMEAMVHGMRTRFLVAAVLSIPILLWSRIGRDVLGFEVAAPFGLSDEWLQLVLSLPVVLYSSWIFFDGAVGALCARTLDMMVLVAVAIGAGWLYSLVVTLSGGGVGFYEAGT